MSVMEGSLMSVMEGSVVSVMEGYLVYGEWVGIQQSSI